MAKEAKMKRTLIYHYICAFLSFIVTIDLVNCQESEDPELQVTIQIVDDLCPLWFYFNTTTKQCECYANPITDEIVKCGKQEAQLRIGYCMTYEEEEGIYLAPCHYFHSNSFVHRATDGQNYIWLPKNISELNDYICGPMNRKGRLCSECIDGFAPSVMSLGFICSNCTDAWYGIPLYLCLEFIPITIFYIIILFFKINVTSAPMVAFLLFSQIVVASFVFYENKFFFKESITHKFLQFLSTLYGFWNLDFFCYVLPPFCVSQNLKLIHIILLYYISAFYPLCLICITWFCIKLYSCNFKPIMYLWNRLCFKCTKSLDYSNALVNAFATFFLLAYAKVVFISSRMLGAPKAVNINNNYSVQAYQILLATGPSFRYFSKEHLPFMILSIAIFLLAILPLISLLTLYPLKAFRSMLFKLLSTRTITSMHIFVERYYSCYRDGTDGGRDMRSMVVLYFILRLIVSVLCSEMLFDFRTTTTLASMLFGGCSLMIALVRPYKRPHMNTIDALLLGNLAQLSSILDQLYYNTQERSSNWTVFFKLIFCTLISFPLLGYAGYILYQILKNLLKKVKKSRLCSSYNEATEDITQAEKLEDDNGIELPDRVLHPKQYDLEKDSSTAYVQYEDNLKTSDRLELYLSQ